MRFFKNVYKFFLHFARARHTKGFGVHSPFVFNFINNVLCEEHPFYVFNKIEALRNALLHDERLVYVVDFGTQKDSVRSVSKIAKSSLKAAKFGQLFYRIIRSTAATNVLELGTSLGVTTAYLAAGNQNIKCVSLEGSPELARLARKNFEELKIENIDIVIGNIDLTLGHVLGDFENLDFVFIDANHRSGSVLNYFELILNKLHKDSVLVIDDIYWSDDMEYAWEEIKNHPNVTTSIDLFTLGIVFFNTDLNKQHYKIRY